MIPRFFSNLMFNISARTRWSTFLLITITALSPLSAQAQDQDVIKVNVDLVTVNVAVKDGKGRSLSGLRPQDFRITDENSPVVAEFFDSEGPASIVFVVDTSSSMQGQKWKSLIAGLKGFLKKARDGNDYSLITFSNSPQLLVQSVSADELLNCLRELKPHGETALYDGVLEGLDVLKRVPQRHRAVVLISDGEDNSSRLSLAEVEKEASAMRTTIYSIGVVLKAPCRSSRKPCDGQATVSQLAKVTGGLVFFPDSSELSSVLKEISNDVRSQYSLSYYPPDKRSGWRQVQVDVAQIDRKPRLRYQQRYLLK